MNVTKVKCSICNGEGGQSSPHGTAFFYICNQCNSKGFRYKHVCEGRFIQNSEGDHAFYLICDDCGASGLTDNREFSEQKHIDYLRWCQHCTYWGKTNLDFRFGLLRPTRI